MISKKIQINQPILNLVSQIYQLSAYLDKQVLNLANKTKARLSLLQFLTFLICLGIIIFQQRERISNAHLWAEDGTVFLMEYWNHGWLAIFKPYAGYLHVLPRLVVSVASSITIDFLPHIIILFTSSLYALCASFIVSKSYEHLITSAIIRVAKAISFCFLPGLWEIVGNVANAHSILFFGSVILCMRDPRLGYTFIDIFFLSLAAFSAGEMIVLIPIFFTRLALILATQKNECVTLEVTHSNLLGTGLILSVLILSSSVVFYLWLQTPNSPKSSWSVLQFIEPTWRSISNRFMLYPWFADQKLVALNQNKTTYAVLTACAFVATYYTLMRLDLPSRILVIVSGMCVFFGIILIWLVRPNSINHGFIIPSQESYRYRYSFQGTFIGVVLAGMVFSRILNKRFEIIWAIFLVFLAWNGASARRSMRNYGSEIDWPSAARQIKSTLHQGCPAKSRIKINPNGWHITASAPPNILNKCSE